MNLKQSYFCSFIYIFKYMYSIYTVYIYILYIYRHMYIYIYNKLLKSAEVCCVSYFLLLCAMLTC